MRILAISSQVAYGPVGNSAAVPALEAAGDEVVLVDGRAVAELGFEASIRAIRGPVESPVELALRKRGEPPLKTLTVTRRKISN